MKELRVPSYSPTAQNGAVPEPVRAITALRFGLFPEGAALFRFSGGKDFIRNLRQARKALDAAFEVERNGQAETWRVRPAGGRVRMDNAHHAALRTALEQALQQGVPSTLIDGLDAAVDWLASAQEIDPNASGRGKR